jgi:succinoglycan biosynthesis protein ExoA
VSEELVATTARWPSVSVVMPVRNEATDLEDAVASVLAQRYPIDFDVVLAVAPSDDGTTDIARRLAENSHRVHIIDNPEGTTPAGLNRAIDVATSDVIVRVDGHARLDQGYIERAVETLCRTGAVNVGGVQRAIGRTPFEDAVALAMHSWVGTGGARYRVGGSGGPVDTVYLGVFLREALEAVGGFDEELIRNQDYELNIRLRDRGGVVWFDPDLEVEYRPRGTLTKLARQYFEYGWWKAVVASRHPASLRPRQVAPVAIVVMLALSIVTGRRVRLLRWARAGYAGGVIAAATSTGTSPGSRFRLMAILPVMHIAWGGGFVASVVTRAARAR